MVSSVRPLVTRIGKGGGGGGEIRAWNLRKDGARVEEATLRNFKVLLRTALTLSPTRRGGIR
jgi:hypothetical protein